MTAVPVGVVVGVAVLAFALGTFYGRGSGRRRYRRRLRQDLDVLEQIAQENSEEYRLAVETTADYLREEFGL